MYSVLAHPDAAVDAGAEVLSELAEELAVDLGAGLIRVDREVGGEWILGGKGLGEEGGQKDTSEHMCLSIL